ncbi:TPA: hypothetical protein ACH3X2_012208 [Trebouxia sp. C0005]
MMRSVFVVLCMTHAIGISADFLAGQTVNVNTYNNELYLEGAGSYQRILYEDAVNSTMTSNMIWSEIYVAPCGIWLPMLHVDLSEVAYIIEGELVGCIIVDKSDGPGCQNFSAGGVVAVPANTLHSAENPGCTPARAMQALSGADRFQQIAMISALFAMSPSSVQYGMNLTAAQVTSSAASIMPTFTVNQACLINCGLTNNASTPAFG